MEGRVGHEMKKGGGKAEAEWEWGGLGPMLIIYRRSKTHSLVLRTYLVVTNSSLYLALFSFRILTIYFFF
jgi:hypothetical protein